MAATMRTSKAASERLDELQARLFLLTREHISKQDLLDLVLEVGPDLERLAARLGRITYPLSEAAKKRIRARSIDWGVKTREEDINRVLYGWQK